MTRDPVELVRTLFAGSVVERPEALGGLLTDDIVINGSGGQVYVGRDGFTEWYEELRASEQLGLADRSFEDLGNGWVLVAAEDGEATGEEHGRRLGCWLARVRNGKVSATLHYRTPSEARKAVRV